MIRKATIGDVDTIHRLLKTHADRGELLPRALSDLYDDIRDFSVFQDDKDGSVVGVCALHVCWEGKDKVRIVARSHNKEATETVPTSRQRSLNGVFDPASVGNSPAEVDDITVALLPSIPYCFT